MVVMARPKRPATRIDLGDQGRAALTTVLDDFFQDQDEPLSELRLRLLVDHLEDHAGRLFYNKAVEEAVAAATQSMARLQDDLDLLRKI
jgi:uncharacterized protein (DUF2164 family)